MECFERAHFSLIPVLLQTLSRRTSSVSFPPLPPLSPLPSPLPSCLPPLPLPSSPPLPPFPPPLPLLPSPSSLPSPLLLAVLEVCEPASSLLARVCHVGALCLWAVLLCGGPVPLRDHGRAVLWHRHVTLHPLQPQPGDPSHSAADHENCLLHGRYALYTIVVTDDMCSVTDSV